MIEEIFNEIINEAKYGKVIIEDEEWPISFNSIVEGKEYIGREDNDTLVINDKNKFIKLLEEYINLELKLDRKTPAFLEYNNKNKIKWIMSYIFVNATTEEFINPIELLNRKIYFLKDNTFNYLNNGISIDINDIITDSKLCIKNEQSPVSMETPNKISLSITNGTNTFNLPSIYYGIDNDTCYIYSILTPKNKKNLDEDNIKYNKKVNRFLYKINDKVIDEELLKYKDTDYYPEGNITDISVSFIFSLNIFESLLEKNNIKKIKVVPYLPLRYKSRNIASEQANNNDYVERNNKIQNNLTNKFIRTFQRLAYHNKNIEVLSYPYELDEFLSININDNNKKINNMLLDNINDKINNNKRGK